MAQMDTTKEGVKAIVVKARADADADAAKNNKGKPSDVEKFKLAVFRFVADSLNVKDVKVRGEAWKQLQATAGSFGTNLSAWNKDNGFRTEGEKVEGYTGVA